MYSASPDFEKLTPTRSWLSTGARLEDIEVWAGNEALAKTRRAMMGVVFFMRV
jgi:hypothetical protein